MIAIEQDANTDWLGTHYSPPMTLQQAIDAGILLVLEPEGPGDVGRPMAHAFVLARGIVYAIPAWQEAAGWAFPFHVVEGKPEGSGPWRIGHATIRKLDHGDPLAGWYSQWVEAEQSPDTRQPSREACWKVILSSDLGDLVQSLL